MTTVETRDGAVRGEARDGIVRFLGIPYAAPPVGERRWTAPEPPQPWEGVREATAFGAMAPQARGGAAQFLPSHVPMDEDCLSLNVWAPAEFGDRPRPVMVWFHGGGYRQGGTASPLYDGEALARRGDVVVVTANYRLGALGFLTHPSLRAGDGEPAGNWGLLDLIESLRWVQANAAAFGGDPGNVTIFGESAGAGCVAVLLAARPAAGLFHKAVVQSGAGTAVSMDRATDTAARLVEAAGVDSLAALRDLPADDIVAAQTKVDGGRAGAMTFLPAIDGYLFDGRPLDAIAAGSAAGIPVIVGTNRDEWKLWAPMDPRSRDLDEDGLRRRLDRRMTGGVDEVIGAVREARATRGEPTAPNDLWFAIESERFFRVPAIELADALTERSPTYVYLFTWESPAMKGWLGACHGLEIAFVFGTQGRSELALFTGSGPEADALAEKMMDAWVAFARTGDPSCDAVGTWPRYGPDRPTMVLNAEHELVHAPFDDERAVVAAHARRFA